MERYGPSETSESDPRMNLTGQGVETGLEEPISQLELGGGGGGSTGDGAGDGESSYPERPGEADCIYYLKTGFCGYGTRCRFNHPRDVVSGGGGPTGGRREFPERYGQPVCQYYMRTGACKFGPSCKYHHPRQGVSSPGTVALNIYGYPVRPGEKECSYYMKTGRCKFGMTCKFHHPLPENLHQVPMAAASGAGAAPPPTALATPMMYHNFHSPLVAPTQQYGVIGGNWQVARPPSMVAGSYVQGPYGPMLLPTGALPVGGWTPYPAPVSALAAPTTQTSVGASQLYAVPPSYSMPPPYATGPYSPPLATSIGPSSSVQKEQSYPERPGQPECQHYLRTGECKFGPSCRYHHPAEISAQKTRSTNATADLPIRPDAPTCAHFMQHGICKLGPSCRFNHPVGSLSYSPSASSLSDIPVAPYPVGSTIPDLAPLSASLDLQTESYSGRSTSNKDSSAKNTSSPNSQTTASALHQSGSGSSSSPQGSSQAN